MITTYNELKSAVADWLARPDLTPVIPTFVQLCEAELNRVLFAPEMEVFATVTTDEQYVALPAFVEIRRVAAGDDELKLVTPEQLFIVRRSLPPTGKPRYAVVGGHVLEVWPVPDRGYTYNVICKRPIPPLSNENQTNWLLQKHPDTYLYGTLTHSAPYLHHDERIAVWSAKFSNLVRQINLQAERMLYPTSNWSVRLKYTI